MSTTAKPLTESVLRLLTTEALMSLLGQAEGFEAAARPGLPLALVNEPVADMNLLVAGAGADPAHFEAMAASCLERGRPFLVLIFPEAGTGLDDTASELGLVDATDWPIMVRDDAAIDPFGDPEVGVARASGPVDAFGSGEALAAVSSRPPWRRSGRWAQSASSWDPPRPASCSSCWLRPPPHRPRRPASRRSATWSRTSTVPRPSTPRCWGCSRQG